MQLPLSASDIWLQTDHDLVLSRVRQLVMHGWPTQPVMPKELQPYSRLGKEPSFEAGCLLWGSRVIMLPALRGKVLDQLHDGHPGIAKMKALAQQYVW